MINGGLNVEGLDSTSYVAGLSVVDNSSGLSIKNTYGFSLSSIKVENTPGIHIISSNVHLSESLIFNNYYLQNTNEGGGFEIVNSFVELVDVIIDSNRTSNNYPEVV